MDKETLSHYGWIVICVLVLSVLLAFASPFGTFIADGFKATYTGLFQTGDSAMDVVMNATGGCTHRETEVTNVTADYSGDTTCKKCGSVLERGKYLVPEGGQYIAADGMVYSPGDEMPEVVTTGDTYEYHDYRYTYKADQNGWHARVISEVKTHYGYVLEEVNGKPITDMTQTWSYIYKDFRLPEDFKIPDTVTTMKGAFRYCDMTKLPENFVVPSSVVDISEMFYGCQITNAPDLSQAVNLTNMENAFYGAQFASISNIPTSVVNLNAAFAGCSKLTSVPDLDKCVNVKEMSYTFNRCSSLVNAPKLPVNVESFHYTFGGCSSLKSFPDISHCNNLTNISAMFYGCISITDASCFVIPSNVKRMMSTFEGCTSLVSAPLIHGNINDLRHAFKGCTSLTGDITINANYGEFEQCFYNTVKPITLYGTSVNLASIAKYCANNGNVVLGE